jgi:hypothetical protein
MPPFDPPAVARKLVERLSGGCFSPRQSGYEYAVDLLEVLRRQAGRYPCPSCGQSLADCGLELVSDSDAVAVVRVTCAHCEMTQLVGVQVAPATKPAALWDQPIGSEPPISGDEVLDVRLALAEHRGDLKSLIPA